MDLPTDSGEASCDSQFQEQGPGFCKVGVKATEQCCQCGGGKLEDIVDSILCRYFGGTVEEGWWEEEWVKQEQFQMLQIELRALKHKQSQQHWCDDPASGLDSDGGLTYSHKDSWSDHDKARDLIPTHYLNAASTATSSISYILWLTSSPHRSKAAETLDKKCNSFSLIVLLVLSC